MTPILLGNSFPLSLIRRPVRIDPRPLSELQEAVAARGLVSFWGHANTTAATERMLGFKVIPDSGRPAVCLSSGGLPEMNEMLFDEVWVLSPDYAPGFRPEIGKEVAPQEIHGWKVLRIRWQA